MPSSPVLADGRVQVGTETLAGERFPGVSPRVGLDEERPAEDEDGRMMDGPGGGARWQEAPV